MTPKPNRRKLLKWSLWLVPFTVLGGVIGRAGWHLSKRVSHEKALPPAAPTPDPLTLNDQGGLSATKVARIVRPGDTDVSKLLPATEGSVSISGSSHTMGGHTLHAGSLHIATKADKDQPAKLTTNPDRRTYTLDAGYTWKQIIAALNQSALSVAVMQSNNDFTVGGSISANAHGWQTRRGPVGSTVRSLRVALADGSIVSCSRDDNADLFHLICGGFGLFGVILSAELAYADDRATGLTVHKTNPADYHDLWNIAVGANSKSLLSYGRLRVSQKHFLEEAVLNVFADQGEPTPPVFTDDTKVSSVKIADVRDDVVRAVFRGSEGSEYGKRLRWDLEILTGGESVGLQNRNMILDTSATGFANRDPERVDILHESFIPRDQFAGFVDDLRRIIPKHQVDLLNITVRDINADTTAHLNYARQDVYALVFLFNLARTPAADEILGSCVREIIDATLDRGGTFYLPYRHYATRAQLERGYPSLASFAAGKDKFDPKHMFRNWFSEHYGLT